MPTQVVGFDVLADSEETRQLFTCAVRRLLGDPDATPDASPGHTPIRLQAETHWKAVIAADSCIAQCADELGIEKPWELVKTVHPD